VLLVAQYTAFWKSVVFSAAGSCRPGSMILLGLLDPEDEGTMLLQMLGTACPMTVSAQRPTS